MSENPLLKLYRNKNIYISLPSKGKYYPSGVNLTIDGEIGVYPMTAKDEILIKSPDALFNGESLIEMIKSCIPDIKNPEEMPVCDLDPLMLAIRASSNKNVEMETTCKHCNETNNYEFDITSIIASAKPIIEDNIVIIDNAKIYCRPFTLKSQIKTNIQKFNHLRIEQLFNNKDFDQNKKIEMFNKIIKETTDLTFEIVSDNILKVVIDDLVVDNKQFINEWILNMEKATYYKIIEKIQDLSDNKMEKDIKTICNNCQQENNIEIDMNPMSFFI
jgi:RNase P subunit RPR2